MRVKITKPCVIEVLPNSIVEISERQLKFLKADYFEIEEKKEVPEKAQRTTRKGKK